MGLRVYGQMLGQLLLRTFARAQRVYLAMKCRGFDGEVRVARQLHFGAADLIFLLGWSASSSLFRVVDVPLLLGQLVTEAGRHESPHDLRARARASRTRTARGR